MNIKQKQLNSILETLYVLEDKILYLEHMIKEEKEADE